MDIIATLVSIYLLLYLFLSNFEFKQSAGLTSLSRISMQISVSQFVETKTLAYMNIKKYIKNGGM